MKKIVLFCIFLCIPTSLYADLEEDKCFELLNTEISNDSRFNNSSTKDVLKNGDLSKVLYDEANSSYEDFSSYSSFKNYLVTNPNPHNFGGLTDKDFIARRNNIGTIIANDNYVITNVVGFGKNSNFTFPLDSKTTPYGDRYKLNGDWFREYVLYTHHNFKGEFMSCGIVKIKPLNGRSFTNISQGGYKTNILTSKSGNCSSGFEGNDLNIDSLEYYKLKSNVCVVDYNDDDYLKMEVISIAYNNGSDYMNEYLTHRLQVKAMKDLGNNAAGGLKGIGEKFMEYVNDKTCLSLIHSDKSTLPSSCNGDYGSEIVYNESRSLFSYLFSTAFARRDGLSLEKEVEKSRGMVAYDNIDYNVYKKLNSIKDKTFKSYLLLSIVPNLEELIENRKKNNIAISPYEETFLSCGIDYKERSKILQDFVKNIKDVNNIDYNNLTYLNPKFGDCIIPYPDKSHLNKVIDNSFSSNKLLAKKINGTYKSPEVSKAMQDYVKNTRKIEADYNEKINELSKKFNEGKIDIKEFNKLINDEKKDYILKKKELDTINKELTKEISKEANKLENAGLVEKDIDDKKINFKTIGLILMFLLIGGGIVFISIKKNKKTQ